jgi:branched-chain amino acid aminotransferase
VIAVSIDGEPVAPDQARISIFDRGLLYGDGVFEVLRTWDGALTELDAHLERLHAACSELGLRTLERERLAEAVARTVAAAGEGEQRIRIVVTRGPGGLGARMRELGPGMTIVIVEPLLPQPAEISLALVDWPLPRRTRPGLKTLAYLDHVLAKELAAELGADDAVRLGPDGEVLECATCNLFLVASGRVVTPQLAGVLPGITRARVLEVCAAEQIAAAQSRISVDELRAADEVFVTSALRGVVAVTRLDGEPRPAGAVTARIAASVRARRAVRPAL